MDPNKKNKVNKKKRENQYVPVNQDQSYILDCLRSCCNTMEFMDCCCEICTNM